MGMRRPRALVETDPETGDLRVTVKGAALGGRLPRVVVEGYTGTPDPQMRAVMTADYWQHLEWACEGSSGTGFRLSGVRGRELEVRESSARALAYRGLVTLWTVRVDGELAGWSAVATEHGRRMLSASGSASGAQVCAGRCSA